MKHYGALLTGANNTIDGGENSVLTVGANDAIIVATARTQSDANLGATISDQEALDAAGLVIATANGATHILGADGREVAISDIGGGSAHALFNPTVHTIPILNRNVTHGNLEWDDSPISLTGGTPAGLTSITATTEGFDPRFTRNLSFTIEAGDATAFATAYALNVRTAATITIGTTQYNGDIERTAATTGRFYNNGVFGSIAVGTTFQLPVASTAHGHTTVTIGSDTQIGTSTSDAFDLTVWGNLTVEGTTTTVNSGTVTIEDKYLAINTPDSGSTVTPDGGLLVTLATATTSTEGAGMGTHAGIRYDESASEWQISQGTPATGGVDANWSAIGTADAGVDQIIAGQGLRADGTLVTGDTGTTNSDLPVDGNIILNIAANTNEFIINSNEAGTGVTTTANAGFLGLNDGGISVSKLSASADTTDTPDRGVAAPTDTHYVLAANRTAGSLTEFTYISPAAGNVNKHAATYTVSGGQIVITSTGGTLPHGLDGSDFTVTVYEYLSGSTGNTQFTGSNSVANLRKSQVFPESVVIGTEASGTGELLEGRVAITLGTPQNGNQFQVIIKS